MATRRDHAKGPSEEGHLPAADDDSFIEESSPTLLSDSDRDRFLELFDNPPEANEALKRIMREHHEREARRGSRTPADEQPLPEGESHDLRG